jgi:hypothetical protein
MSKFINQKNFIKYFKNGATLPYNQDKAAKRGKKPEEKEAKRTKGEKEAARGERKEGSSQRRKEQKEEEQLI